MAITHHNVTQLLGRFTLVCRMRAWALCHSLAFDVSVGDLWCAVARRAPGGRVRVGGRFPHDLHRVLVPSRSAC
ncbi:hypothetical protein [Mycobacterium timonense]|uniref:hypothetical protein n=1 Tax=Mycobacterium timonense TaxID=701043 RepID=UPI0035A2DC6C